MMPDGLLLVSLSFAHGAIRRDCINYRAERDLAAFWLRDRVQVGGGVSEVRAAFVTSLKRGACKAWLDASRLVVRLGQVTLPNAPTVQVESSGLQSRDSINRSEGLTCSSGISS